MKDNETIPGGYYIGVDGTPHDANGNPLPVIPDIDQIIETAETPAQAEEAVQEEAAPVKAKSKKKSGVVPDAPDNPVVG